MESPINTRVVEIMKYLKLSQKEFALSLDISQPTLTYISNGRNKVSLDIVQKIAKIYPQINLKWLVLGEEGMLFKEEKKHSPQLLAMIQEVEIVSRMNNSNLTDSIDRLKKMI